MRSNRTLLTCCLLAFLLGVLVCQLLLHGPLAGNPLGCSYDPLPFGLDASPLGQWLQVLCGA